MQKAIKENKPQAVEFQVRDATQSDEEFICSSWLQSYKHSSAFAKRITFPVFFGYHHKIIERILKGKGTKVLVACAKDDENTILGYLVTQDAHDPVLNKDVQIIHYSYVKGVFRGLGVATELIKVSGVDLNTASFTHWTFDPTIEISPRVYVPNGVGMDTLSRKYPNLIYNPYLI